MDVLCKKCSFPEGIDVRLDGKNSLDPCIYDEIEKYANVTVTIMRCRKCGHIDISWERQEDTEEIELN